METKDNSAINLAYLQDLAKGDIQFINDMITLFLEQTPEAIGKLEKSYAEKNWKALRMVAHKMKPSFSFVGLQELSGMVNLIEEFSEKEIHLDQLPEMIAKVKSACVKAMDELIEQKKNLQA